MNTTQTRKKSISLIYRGFETSAQDAAKLFGVPASRFGNRGEPVKRGVKTLLTRSYVGFSVDFKNDHTLCDMLPVLLAHLGGLDHLCDVKNRIQPEFVEIHFDIPVSNADEMQDGYLSAGVIADIFRLKANLSLAFF